MSVHVLYKGRIGNHLFQYICARLFARKHGLRLATPFTHPELVRMTPHEQGEWVEGSHLNNLLDDGHNPFGLPYKRARYIFDGYFQDGSWYHGAKKEIESFAFPATPAGLNQEDLVVNLRLGKDYRDFGWVIDPSWYLEIISQEQFKRLHIVADVADQEYLRHFAKFDPIVVTEGPTIDWSYLRSFDRIVCSNSTFCWWAAFFSNATRIYTFKQWVGRPEVKLGPFPGRGVEVDGRFRAEAR